MGDENKDTAPEAVSTAAQDVVPEAGGAFLASLKRNNRKIRDDRAQAIHEDAQIIFRRTLEDIEIGIKRMKMERQNMLDLSPERATSLVLASDFNSDEYVQKEVELGVKIRNEEIKFELLAARYKYLFGAE